METSEFYLKQKKNTQNARIGFLCVAIAEFLCACGVRWNFQSIPNSTGIQKYLLMDVIMVALIVFKLIGAAASFTALFFPKKQLRLVAFGVTCIGNAGIVVLWLLAAAFSLGMAVTIIPAVVFKDFYETISDIVTILFLNIGFLIFPCIVGFVVWILQRKK